MKLKTFLYIFLFVILSSFVFAANVTDGRVRYSFETGSGTNVTNRFNESVFSGLTVNSPTWDPTGKCDVYSMTFNGVDSALNTNYVFNGAGGVDDFSLSFWLNTTEASTDALFGASDNVDDTFFGWISAGGKLSVNIVRGGSSTTTVSTTTVNDGAEHFIVITTARNGNTNIYVDGNSSEDSDVQANNPLGVNDQLYFGNNDGVGTHGKGTYDEVLIFNRELTTQEIGEVYAGGGCFDWVGAAAGLNESLENAFMVEQVGSVAINSVVYADILSSDFNSGQNSTAYYSSTITLSSTGNSVAQCRLLVDGVDFDSSSSRTMVPSDVASMYLTTNGTNVSDGNHTIELQCRKLSGGNYIVSNSIVIGHLLYDENLNNLLHETINLNSSLSSSFSVLDSFLFNTSNLTSDGEHNSTIIVNWDAGYFYNATGNITTFISIGSNNCSHYLRGGSAGTIGSVGGDCILNNAGFNNSYNISVYGKGSGLVTGNFHIKEFIVDFGEVNSTSLNNTNITSSSLTEIATTVINDTDHASFDLFVKAGIPHVSNSGITTSNFLLQLDGVTNGSIVSRKVGSVTGVSIIQFLFSDITIGSHNVSLLAGCDNGDCSVVGGDLTAYITNEITTITNQVNISAFDIYDDSSVLVFNVTDSGGNVFSSSSGSLLASSVNPLEDYVIRSNGFFDETVLNHNTSNDLNVSLKQSIISFQAFKKVSGASISSFSVTDGNVTNVTTSGNATLFLQVGDVQNITFFGSGSFFNQTISVNVSSLDNMTYNFSSLFDAQINLTAFNSTAGSLLSNLSGNVVFGVFNESFSTTGTNVVLNLTKGLDLSVYLTSRPNHTDAHAGNFQTINLSSNFTNTNFSLFRDQSIFISFNDILTGVGLNDVKVFLFGSANFNFTVNTSSFEYPFPIDTYNLLATKTDFSSFTTTVNIVDGGLVNISAFMNNNTSPVSFIVRDISGGFIEGAVVSVTRSSDGALIGSRSTDIFGAVEFGLNEDIAYNINVTKSGFLPFFGSLNAFQSSYTITLGSAGANQQFFIGLSYEFLPSASESLTNDTLSNFSFNISSNGFWDLSSCSFELLNGSFDGLVVASNSSFCNVSNGFASIVFNTSSFDLLVGKATFFLNGSDSVSVYRFYSVNDNFQGDFSLMTVFDDILNFDKAGFTSVSLFFLTVFVIVGVTVTLGSQLNVFGEPEKMLLFATVLVGAASFVGLLTVDFAPKAFPEAGQWIIFTFMGLLTIASIISSANWRLS